MTERYEIQHDNLGNLLYDNWDEKYIIGDDSLPTRSYINEICCLLNEKQGIINSQCYVIKGYQQRNDDLFNEKIRIERVIIESIQQERTCIGKNVLKQLAQALGIDYEL